MDPARARRHARVRTVAARDLDAWAAQDGTRLRFEGEHYRFTRMQPFFTPALIEHPEIPIYLGAVGPAMTRLTGEVADGFFTHSCNSDPRMIREIAMPAVEAGAKRGGRSLDDVDVMVSPYMNTGSTAEEIAESREANRRQMAIMYSTPNYGARCAARRRGNRRAVARAHPRGPLGRTGRPARRRSGR